jgi:hypothetical protein
LSHSSYRDSSKITVLTDKGEEPQPSALSKVLNSFSLNTILADLRSSRCKPWDNRELDCLEGFKYISMFLIILNYTAFYLMTAPLWDPWQVLDFFQSISLGIVISSNIACEAFFFLSAFIGGYQCFMILDAKDSKFFSIKDIGKIYIRKYMRLAPFYYFILFLGWSSCSDISDGPVWSVMNGLWYDCSSTWVYKVLFVGNIIGF